jgi:hypothetical protein
MKDGKPEMANLVWVIWSAAALLALTRESPATRVIITMTERERDGRRIRAVVDWPDDVLLTRTMLARSGQKVRLMIS